MYASVGTLMEIVRGAALPILVVLNRAESFPSCSLVLPLHAPVGAHFHLCAFSLWYISRFSRAIRLWTTRVHLAVVLLFRVRQKVNTSLVPIDLGPLQGGVFA